jgi:hypothetical protein
MFSSPFCSLVPYILPSLRTRCQDSRAYRNTVVHLYLLTYIVSWGGVWLSPLCTSATNWPIVPAPDNRWWVWSSRWNENLLGKPKHSVETCPRATFSTTNPSWADLGSDLGRRGEKSVTNSLSYGTAWIECYHLVNLICMNATLNCCRTQIFQIFNILVIYWHIYIMIFYWILVTRLYKSILNFPLGLFFNHLLNSV